jgi:YgiT-type zinc finger domain-containing protein
MIEYIFCKHRKAKLGLVSVTLERDNCLIILTRFPLDICKNCAEYYLSESVTDIY